MALTSRSIVLVTLVTLILGTSPAGAAGEDQRTAGPSVAPGTTTRITAAANVTLRAMPSPDATTVAQLPLGTELNDAGPAGLDKTWTRVKLEDGREGWLVTNLTRPLDPVWRWPVFDRIIAERLGRKGDGYTASAELVAFIERVGGEYVTAEGKAQLEYSRLRAIAAAASGIPLKGAGREPYASWISRHKTDVVYDEPSGRWMLSSGAVWDAHTKHATTSISDDLAWFAVTNGLPGECEGYLICYLSARNQLHGEYLRRRPFGKHAAEAVGVIKSTAETLAAPSQSKAGYIFDRKTDCKALTDTTEALAKAIEGTRVEGRDTALTILAGLRKLCQ